MAYELWYPTVIHYSILEEPELSLIQTELLNCVEKIKLENKFAKNPSWSPDTTNLSDPTFSENLIDVHNLNEFRSFLSHEVYAYLLEFDEGFARNMPEFKIIESWFTLTKPGERQDTHNHGSYDISGVYYVQSNGEDGKIYFECPVKQMQSSHIFKTASRRFFDPEVGKLILFPGWLEHGVFQNKTNDERISLSFNISFRRY